MKRRTEKRYYTVGETVWVKSEKKLGVIKELNIKPKEKVFEAMIEISNKNEESHKIVANLWDIDKNKLTYYRQQRMLARFINEMKTEIIFAKVQDTAIIPSKSAEDGGYDIYADIKNPTKNLKGKVIQAPLTIDPNGIELIPTGIASCLTEDFALIFKERGSTGTIGMAVRAGVVDSGFRNQWNVVINNTGNKPICITYDVEKTEEHDDIIYYPASKAIAQALLQIVPKADQKVVSYEDLKKIPSKRNQGSLGSSNK